MQGHDQLRVVPGAAIEPGAAVAGRRGRVGRRAGVPADPHLPHAADGPRHRDQHLPQQRGHGQGPAHGAEGADELWATRMAAPIRRHAGWDLGRAVHWRAGGQLEDGHWGLLLRAERGGAGNQEGGQGVDQGGRAVQVLEGAFLAGVIFWGGSLEGGFDLSIGGSFSLRLYICTKLQTTSLLMCRCNLF